MKENPRGLQSCTFSRTLWQEDEDSNRKIKTKGRLNAEGYVNVGDQLGFPSERGELINRALSLLSFIFNNTDPQLFPRLLHIPPIQLMATISTLLLKYVFIYMA